MMIQRELMTEMSQFLKVLYGLISVPTNISVGNCFTMLHCPRIITIINPSLCIHLHRNVGSKVAGTQLGG